MVSVKTELLCAIKQEIHQAVSQNLHDLKKSISSDFKEMKASLDNAHEEIYDLKKKNQELERQVNDLASQCDESKLKEARLSAQIEELKDKQIMSEAYNRRENLIVYGIDQDAAENWVAKFQNFLVVNLKMPDSKVQQIKIQRCHRLNSSLSPQPMICRFLYFPDRMAVWGARFNLKGTAFSLCEDFPPEIVSRRKSLYPIWKAAKKDKKDCSLVGDKLKIEGVVYTDKTLHTLPGKYNPANLATQTKNGVTAFFSKSSPLSNFYKCNISIDGHSYSSVEQYLQHERAIHGGKPDVAAEILVTSDPAKCKSLGKKVIVNEEEWLPIAMEAVKKACRIKFTSDPTANMYLKNTADTTLAEAGPDREWGVGLHLSNTKVHNKNEWTGRNRLGAILEAVRNELL